MTIKNAIAIGKGLGLLLTVEDNSGAKVIFRSYLLILVSLDVSKPFNLGFTLTREDGSSSWISLRYERLDIYCIDCGLIGHHQASCLAFKEDKFPSSYTIYLKVNVFSNLITTISSSSQPANPETSPSSPRKNPIQPFLNSTPSQANQTNILTSSQNPLSSQKPTTGKKSHAQDTPCHLSTFATRTETPIECTLNALSLFQKRIQLFSSPSTSLTNQTNPLKLCQVDPSQHITFLSCDSEPSSTKNSNKMATSTKITSSVLAKAKLFNKQIRKSPKTTIQPIPSPHDLNLSNKHIPTITTPQQLSRKRSNTIVLAFSQKKGPGAANEIQDPFDPSPSPIHEFNPSYFEKTPTRAIFKAARKGKNKIVSVELVTELDSASKRALLSLPNTNEDLILELQGAS
jgi:hypothetical protein